MGVGVGYLLTAAIAVDQRERSKRQERRSDRLRKVEQAQVSESAARERRNQIRQSRMAAAEIQNAAAATGIQNSSAEIASVAGVRQQAAIGIGDINQTVGFNDLTNQLQRDIFELNQPSDLQLFGTPIANAAMGGRNNNQ